MHEMEFYRCGVCGNMAVRIKKGCGTLACCDQPMTKLSANTSDAAREKHVPAVSVKDGKIEATVGSVLHPMTPEHHIEWIAVFSEGTLQMEYLRPGMKPTAEFAYPNGEAEVVFSGEKDEVVPNCEGSPCNFVYGGRPEKGAAVYEYCNLHGLWKAEI